MKRRLYPAIVIGKKELCGWLRKQIIKFAFYEGTCYSKNYRNRDLDSQNGKGYNFELNPRHVVDFLFV